MTLGGRTVLGGTRMKFNYFGGDGLSNRMEGEMNKTFEEITEELREAREAVAAKWAVQYRDQINQTPTVTSDTDEVNPTHYSGEEVYKAIGTVISRLELQPQSYSDLSNVLKYLLRCGLKGELQIELKKAQWYLNKLVKREE